MRLFLIHYEGVSKEMQKFKYSPIQIPAETFLEAVVKGVAQVEYQEPGNFRVVKVEIKR